jgi:hypothetical protein
MLEASNAQWYNDEYVNGTVWRIDIGGLSMGIDPEFQVELGAADGFIVTQHVSHERIKGESK